MSITSTSVMLKSVALQKSSINLWQKVVRMQPEHGSLVGCCFFFVLALLRCRLGSQSHSAPQLQMCLTTLRALLWHLVCIHSLAPLRQTPN